MSINAKKHLTKRYMGNARGHRAVHRSGSVEQHHPDKDGKPDHAQLAHGSPERPEQRRFFYTVIGS